MSINKWGRAEQVDRNMEIARAVLKGGSCASVAKDHNVAPERARQITAKYCRIANRERYNEMPERRTVDLPWLRENKADFLTGLST